MERGIEPIVAALQHCGITTVSSCEGHTESAYITTAPMSEKDAAALSKLLQQALASFSLEDIFVRPQKVDMPENAPFSGRTIFWLINYQKLLPKDKERVARKVGDYINKTISPQS